MQNITNQYSQEEVRRNWRKCWLRNLYDITSLQNQEEHWLAKRSGEMQTFVECMCSYFDDSSHGWSLEDLCEKGFLSKSEIEACRDFHNLANDYNPPISGDDEDILGDPKWHAVVEAAQEIWKRLREIITSQEELAIMEDCDKEDRI